MASGTWKCPNCGNEQPVAIVSFTINPSVVGNKCGKCGFFAEKK